MSNNGQALSPSEYAAQQGEHWQNELAAKFGREVQRHRTQKGLSAVGLSEITKQAGFHITRSTIAKIEGNHRGGKIDVSELLILAAALDVPPGILLFPGYPAATVTVLPEPLAIRNQHSSFHAVEWLAGRERTPNTPVDHGDVKVWGRGSDKWERMVKLIEEREALADSSTGMWHGPLSEVIQAGMQHVSPEVRSKAEQLLEEQARKQDRVEELNEQIAALGGYVGESESDGTR